MKKLSHLLQGLRLFVWFLHLQWEIEVLDVKTTFLFGKLDEDIYMVQPEGIVVMGQELKVCHL